MMLIGFSVLEMLKLKGALSSWKILESQSTKIKRPIAKKKGARVYPSLNRWLSTKSFFSSTVKSLVGAQSITYNVYSNLILKMIWTLLNKHCFRQRLRHICVEEKHKERNFDSDCNYAEHTLVLVSAREHLSVRPKTMNYDFL